MRWLETAPLWAVILATPLLLARPDQSASIEITANDNRTPAGVLADGVLSVDLVAGAGTWFPEAENGPGHDIYAFGVGGAELSNPGPLLRVPAGTEVRATIRNDLPGPLTVHGLFDRPGSPVPITVQPNATARVRFRVTEPGTYHYWGSTRAAARLTDRFGMESQLLGALIVDAPGAAADDHVFVLGIEDDSAALPAQRRLRAAVVNGRSWPHAHSSTVQLGDTVRMRWINTTDRFHPMHLHGFYFRVDARGDIAADTIYDDAEQRRAVTELLAPGQTMAITWVPDRTGNWLMHCHMTQHMAPALRDRPHMTDATHVQNHSLEMMSGLVTGWRVLPRANTTGPVAPVSPLRPREIRLLAQSAPHRYGVDPALGFVIQQGDIAPAADSVVVPGPPLVLVRGQPVRIRVVNRLTEPTSIHWHGIELDSYYDGVSGWSGDNTTVAPHIAPGDSFDVRFTPPRAGTFIYHTHLDEERQLSSGMYGPIIVLEPGERYNPATDLTWVLSQKGPVDEVRVMLNGSEAPQLDMYVNTRYRIRLININPNVPLTVFVERDSVPVLWRAIAKDGADLPVVQTRMQEAVQRIGVGETYDFELTPDSTGTLSVRALNPIGSVRVSGTIRIHLPPGGVR